MKRTVAVPLGGDALHVDLTPQETAARQAEESAFRAAQIVAALPAYRWERENSGITVGGVSVLTDQATRTNLIGARIRAVENPAYTVQWKTPNGFVTLSAVQIIAIADAVAAHVQKCFDAEAELTGQTFESVSALKTAFDVAYDNG